MQSVPWDPDYSRPAGRVQRIMRSDVRGHPHRRWRSSNAAASGSGPLAHHQTAHARRRPVPLETLALHRLSASLTGGQARGQAASNPASPPPSGHAHAIRQYLPMLPCYYVRIITVPTIRADRPSKYAKLFVSSTTPEPGPSRASLFNFCCMASPGDSQRVDQGLLDSCVCVHCTAASHAPTPGFFHSS